VLEIIKHILIHALKDGIKIIPFLFIAFVLIEIIEHKLTKHTKKIITKFKKTGPIIGSTLGIIPQCGFSVIATNLYITRIITLGTLIAIYLSTSDEMLPILLSQNVEGFTILKILLIKFFIGVMAGIIIDFIIRKQKPKEIEDFSICEEEHCHCEKGILLSSIKHTISISIFIIIATIIINLLLEVVGTDNISKILLKDSIFAPFISSLIGLIPNCGSSVIITELYINNIISLSTMIAGLLTGSGVALLVLFKSNKNLKENLIVLSIIYGIGVISGIILNVFI